MEIEEAPQESSNFEFKQTSIILMPKKNIQKPNKKQARGRKRGAEMEIEAEAAESNKGNTPILSLNQSLQTKINKLKQDLLEKKNRKLLKKLREKMGISNTKGQKPSLALAPRLFLIFLRYETIYYQIEQSFFEKEIDSDIDVYHSTQYCAELSDYISVIKQTIKAATQAFETKGAKSSKKPQGKILLNFTDLTSFSENQLVDLIKYCVEEFIRNEDFPAKNSYYFIFPTTSTLDFESFNSSEVKVAQIDFSEEKQLFSTFVIDLLLDNSFFPIFGKSILRDMLIEFRNYNVTFKAMVKRLGILCMDFLKSLREKEVGLFHALIVDQKAPESLADKSIKQFTQSRKGFVESLTLFDILLKKHFKYSKGRRERLLHYLIYSEEAFLLPDSFNSDFQSVQEINNLCQQMAETVEHFNKGLSRGNLQEFATDLKSLPEKTERLLNKKIDKRAKQLIGEKLAGTSDAQQHQQATELLRDIMRQFVHLNIKDVYEQMGDNYEQFCYNQRTQAFSMIKPDIMGDTIKEIVSEKAAGFRAETGILTKIFFEFGSEIDLPATYEAFKEEMGKLSKKRRKDEIEMGFVNAVSENKYLGLISDTQKKKFKMAKHFFAKTVYFDYSMN